MLMDLLWTVLDQSLLCIQIIGSKIRTYCVPKESQLVALVDYLFSCALIYQKIKLGNIKNLMILFHPQLFLPFFRFATLNATIVDAQMKSIVDHAIVVRILLQRNPFTLFVQRHAQRRTSRFLFWQHILASRVFALSL